MVRPLLTLFAQGLLVGMIMAAGPPDERLRLLSADIWEHTSRNGQAVDSLSGKVKLRKGEMELFTDWAVFYRGDARAHLSGSVEMVRPGEFLTCDSLVFFDREDKIHAWGDTVRLKQEDKTITSREIVYWTELDSAIAWHDVVMTQAARRLTTDEFHYQKTEGQRGASFRAFSGVVMEEGDRHVSGQRMTYDDTTGVLDLAGDAVVREGDRELRGTRVQLIYEGDELQKGLVEEGAEATALIQAKLSPEDQNWREFAHDFASRTMGANFVNDRLATVQLQGMATSIYHVVEDSILQGMNHTTGDTLTMDFDEDAQLVRIQVRGGARGRFKPEPGNTDVDTVVVYQAEYIDYQIPQEVTYLERGARVDYKENGLAAGYIRVTWQDNLVRAEVAFQEQPTLYQTGRDPMYGQLMEFDMVKETGWAVKGRTKLENGHYYGELVHRHPGDAGDVYYVRRSLYTTCELDPPHFYFAAQRMKMLQGDKVIAKPIILYLMDVPLLGLPFIVFPNESGGRRTGWIMPNYGQSAYHGRYLEGLGYFWVINDYADATSWLDFFDKRGIQARGRFRYNKRYRYSGQLNATLFRLVDDGNISNLFTEKAADKWSGSWSHHQTIDPTQQLNVNASFTSDPRMFRDHGLDRRTRLNQQIVSSANYSKRWPGTSNRLTLALQEKYDLQAADRLETPPGHVGQRLEEKSRTLPRLTFGRASSALFKPGRGQAPRWYHNIRWSLNSNLNNHQSIFWEAITDTADSPVWPEPEDRTVVNRASARNNISLQAQQKVFRYISMSLSLGINQDWTPSYRRARIDEDTGAFLREGEDGPIIYEEIDAFRARHTGSLSLSARTTIYGLLPVRIGSLEAVRHVIKPSISFSYTPDFSAPLLRYDLGYFQYSSDPHDKPFDRFAGSPIGGTPSRKSQSLGISVSNLFQAKREVEGKEVKTNLLTWNMSAGYNFTADSLRLSPIRSSFRSPFLQKLNLDISMEHDFYEWDEAIQRRVNRVRVIPRLARMSASTRLRLSGKRFVPLKEALPEEEEALVDTLQPEVGEEPEDAMSFRRGVVKPSIAPGNLWEATLVLRYSLIPSLDPERRETFWLNGNFKLSIGPGWKVGYAARFDMLTQELISHDLQLYRQLHCWEFSFSWTPSGSWRGFMLRINVRDADLQDIKYESRGGRQSFLGIY